MWKSRKPKKIKKTTQIEEGSEMKSEKKENEIPATRRDTDPEDMLITGWRKVPEHSHRMTEKTQKW